MKIMILKVIIYKIKILKCVKTCSSNNYIYEWIIIIIIIILFIPQFKNLNFLL